MQYVHWFVYATSVFENVALNVSATAIFRWSCKELTSKRIILNMASRGSKPTNAPTRRDRVWHHLSGGFRGTHHAASTATSANHVNLSNGWFWAHWTMELAWSNVLNPLLATLAGATGNVSGREANWSLCYPAWIWITAHVSRCGNSGTLLVVKVGRMHCFFNIYLIHLP